MASIVHDVFFLFFCMPVLVWGGVVCGIFPSTFLLLLLFVLLVLLLHHHHSSSSSSSSSFLLLLLSSLLYYSLPTIMATSASLFIEALSNLYYIVVTYLCIKGWWLLLVNKVVHAVHYLVACTHIGYGRLAHSFLSAIFILLAVPDLLSSWLLAWSAPLSLAGGCTGLLALTAVAANPAPLDPGPLDSSRFYIDTATTAFFANNEAMLAGPSPVDVLINSANRDAPATATAVGSSRFRSVTSGRVWNFSDVYYSADMPATILPLSAM